MVEQAVIVAGGKGARLGLVTERLPKALVEIGGRPLVEHQIAVAARHGIHRFLFLTGHLGDVLAERLGNGARFGVEIAFRREAKPLGTAGALKDAAHLLDNEFFVFYGDIVFDLDLDRIVRFHHERNAIATLVVHPNDHPQDSDVVEADGNGRIVAFHPKTRSPESIVPNLVSAGIYLLSRRCLAEINKGVFADFGLDIFPRMLRAGHVLAAYNTPEYAKDAGTPDRLAAVERDLRSGKVARRNLTHSQKAVFLDRDGVITEEMGDRVTAQRVTLLPQVPAALSELNKSDFLSLVVTNQPGVAKGFLSEADVALVHSRIDMMLAKYRCYVHGYFACPHHPEKGFAGERPELKIVCECRKPLPGLLLRAARQLNIDLGASFLVGDRTIDIAAAHNAGACGVGVRTGYGCTDGLISVKPDFVCDDLSSATKLILDHQGFIEPAARLAELVAEGGSSAVAIGGLARSGKSVFARLLRWQLRRRGRAAVILQLDDFLHPEPERKRLPRVGERYDTAAIEAAVTTAAGRADSIIIVEGVLALDLPTVRSQADYRIYIAIDEGLRHKRFLAFYHGRGYSESEAQALYDRRDVEERSTVSASAAHANMTIVNEICK
jgi:histidinol-phosphate phosphatase family protein